MYKGVRTLAFEDLLKFRSTVSLDSREESRHLDNSGQRGKRKVKTLSEQGRQDSHAPATRLHRLRIQEVVSNEHRDFKISR